VLMEIEVPIFITGHSLGGALAFLAASVFPPRAAYTFGAPKAGDAVFAFGLDAASVYRMTNHRDIVPAVPPSRIPFDYCHAGEHRHYEYGGFKKTEKFEKFSFPDLKTRISRHSYQLLRQRLAEPPDFLSDHAPVNYSAHLTKELYPEPYAAAEELTAMKLEMPLEETNSGNGAGRRNAATSPTVLPDR
jgi:triacylglycerol lipase